MNIEQPFEVPPSFGGGFKVDVSRGDNVDRVASEWFSRPDDQKFLSLDYLFNSVKSRADSSRTRTVESAAIRVEAHRENPESLALVMPGSDEPIAPTHWSFGQLASLVSAPAAYLRQLPAPLAGINLQYGLTNHRAEQIKTLETSDGRTELRAVTGPDYGRIYDHELVSAVQRIAGNGTGDTRWKVPGVLDWSTGIYNPRIDVTKETTTLYASDRDVFLFLVDDLNPIEAGLRPDGTPDLYFRGFYCWNSEVGAKTLGIASFYLRAVCQNRNLWGVEDFQEIKIRHSKYAASRFAHEAAPALTSFANSSPAPFIEGIQAAEGLSQLPTTYGDIPRLGPPLPGELGRPILSAQERGDPMPVPTFNGLTAPGLDPEEQLRLQESDAARLSALFAESQTPSIGGAGENAVPGSIGPQLFPTQISEAGPLGSASAEGVLETGETVSAERLMQPQSPYIVQAGSVIPAALITGLRSDLPGQITAQVTSNVFDSPSGRYLLIPQGARLLGEYDSGIAFGQNRLLLVWTRMILPDGRSITLGNEPGADGTGAAGLRDRVDYHWGRIFLAAGLATILNLGLEGEADSEDDVANAIRDAAQNTIGRTGSEIVRQQIAVPPTLTIRPGFPVMVTRDLILEPLGEVR